jgi:bifunctional non-homologous end joining protein LigD
VASADAFNTRNLPERLAALRGVDPWDGYFDLKQSLSARALRALGVI